MPTAEFRWSEIQREADQALNDLVKQACDEIAKHPEQYPDDTFDRQQFEIRQQERADEWIGSAYEIYGTAFARLGYQLSPHSATVWNNGLSEFINSKINRLLQLAFGLTAKDQEWLRLAPSAMASLSKIRRLRIGPDFVKGSRAGSRVEIVKGIVETLKEKWSYKLC